VANGLTLMLTLNVPATVGLVVLSVPIVQVIFEHGAFTAADTLATAMALQFYALGLVGYSIVRITSPVFYALGHNRTPVAVSVGAILVNAALNLMLVRLMGYRGLALGTSIAALINAATLMYLLARIVGGLNTGQIASTLARIGLASAAMAAAVMVTSRGLAGWAAQGGVVVQLGALALTIAIGLAVLIAAAVALRIPELTDALAAIRRRLRRAFS
jgi:putative peptidoglycan lipid II flippase